MTRPGPAIVPLGEGAWTVVLGNRVDRELHRRVTALASRIGAAGLHGLIEVVPAYAAVTVFFEGDAEAFRARLAPLCDLDPAHLPGRGEVAAARLHTIPVSYAGPDLDHVSRETGLSREEIIRRHSAPEYVVYLLGFAPGFGYLGDLDPALVLPRRASPRTRVPAGSVAIAGAQTAVYPLATPGGWHLIGSTTLRMFDPAREPAALLAAGDRVRFEPSA
ncbi:MAG TPA: 5-oxoprolinase subunit PxpB [Gemmatimonadales bacterium]